VCYRYGFNGQENSAPTGADMLTYWRRCATPTGADMLPLLAPTGADMLPTG
jgi:hypothetical protein